MENVFYINRNVDTNRNIYMQNQLTRLGILGTRVEAVEGNLLFNDNSYREKVQDILKIDKRYFEPEWVLNRSNFKVMTSLPTSVYPRFGLYLSTIKALMTAQDHGLNSCTILEDDAIIKSNVKTAVVPEADVVYLGGTFLGPHDSDDELIKIKSDRLKVFGTFGYIVQDINSILKILKAPFQDGQSFDKHADWRSGNIKLRAQSIDNFYKNYFQKYGNCFFINPQSVTHPLDNLSTINKKQYNYEKCGLRFKY